MTSYARRDIQGGAIATTLASGISSGDPAFTLSLATGWPSGGANGDFFVVIDRGNSNEEKILCASRTATAVTVQTAGRGVDGTSAVAHSSGASVEHCLFARDASEANLAVAKTVGVASAVGQVLVADAANSFAAVQGKTSGQLLMGNGTTVVSQAVTGDVTISGGGATTIGAQKVGVAKMTSTATDRLFGRDTAAAGAGEELTVGGGVEFTGTGGIQRSALTGDVTASAGSGTTSIAGLALSKLATQADQTIVGNRSGGVGVPTAMTAAQTLAVLSGAASASFSVNSQKITNLATPTTGSTDAANAAYAERFKLRYITNLPSTGSYINNSTIATITVTDPGYDITVYVAGTILATADTLSYWEIYCTVDGVKKGGIIIPQAQSTVGQSYAVLTSPVTHTTGTNCTVLLKSGLASGTGGLNVQANTGANNLFTVYYTAA